MRINAVGLLSQSLSDFPALAAVRTEVAAFHQDLLAVRTEQQGFEGDLAELRAKLEDARLVLAEALFSTFGFLIYLYRGDPDRVSRYFELQYLRNPHPTGGDPDAIEEDEDYDAEEPA